MLTALAAADALDIVMASVESIAAGSKLEIL